MTTKSWRYLVLLPWLSLPLLLGSYLLLWDKLPPRLAVHFNLFTGNADTRMTRSESLIFDALVLLLLLSCFSWRLLRTPFHDPPTRILISFYFVIAVLLVIFWMILGYNLRMALR